MKILVATRASTVPREDDFNFAFDNEALSLSTLICATAEARVECGCGRCFSGIESTLSTTYAVVEEADESDFRPYFVRSPHVRGWLNDELAPDETADVLWHDVAEIDRLLADVDVGTEIRADVLQAEFSLQPQSGADDPLHGTRSPRLRDLVDAGLRSNERRPTG